MILLRVLSTTLSSSAEEVLNKLKINLRTSPMRLMPKSSINEQKFSRLNYNTTTKTEHILTVSNLVFLAISQLEIRHLEIIKKLHLRGRIRPREIIEVVSEEMKIKPSSLLNDLEKLSEMKILYHKKNSDEELELTDVGRLIAQEVMREV